MTDLTFSEVGQILRLLQAIDGTDVDLEWGDLRLHVKRPGLEMPQQNEISALTSVDTRERTDTESQIMPIPTSESEVSSGDTADVPEHWISIGSPMVGTFYRSPKPGDSAYVEVGDSVAVGDTVALVEVMKLFTELNTHVAGKVVRIDAEDGILVEFGQPLIWIEPA